MALRHEIKKVARGWRWGHQPLTPASVAIEERTGRSFPTAWARSRPARVARDAILRAGFDPLLGFELERHVYGLERLESIAPPVIFVANHSSHIDAPLILTSLPREWRDRTAVGAAADYFFDVWWRATATALAFAAFPIDRRGKKKSTNTAVDLLHEGWNVVMFPEGTRSHDGWVAEFRVGAALLAIEAGVPVVPLAISGTYQAMPRGRSWPRPGRPAAIVRFGRALVPGPNEDPRAFTERIRSAIGVGLEEQRTTWWDAIRRDARDETPDPGGPDAARWRRLWEASRPLPQSERKTAWSSKK